MSRHLVRIPRRVLILLAVMAAIAGTTFAVVAQAAAPSAPSGLTAISFNGKVELAWQPISGATYDVLRGTSATTITTVVSSNQAGTTYTDTGVTNSSTYFYAVRARNSGGTSANSGAAQATPRATTCSSANPVVAENCFPGSTSWKAVNPPVRAYEGGIEGFASATSINAGQSVTLKINTKTDNVNYHIEIYRTGYYGGTQGRLISVIPGLKGQGQLGCDEDYTTGEISCANWDPSLTVSTTPDWPTGVYLLRLVRDDGSGNDSQILLTVRNDQRTAKALFVVPTNDYQAYNNYGGKGLYDQLSSGATTVSGTARAVAVSLDRPFTRAQGDWYPAADIQEVSWLEHQGYDISYATSNDLDAGMADLNQHKVIISGSHDEYWTQGMRDHITAARNAGAGLVFFGANAMYWRVRYTDGGRTMVCYKSTQSGGPDPSGFATGLFRDPRGANQPENALIGVMYFGDNDVKNFPLSVSASQGQNRLWRYTSAGSQAAGGSVDLGSALVGAEWDTRVANGQEPAGLTTVFSRPVDGNLLQADLKTYAPGTGTQMSTAYRGPGGNLVWATGTNHWTWGLGLAEQGYNPPDISNDIGQATMNMLGDMGANPDTPASGLIADGAGGPSVSSVTPAAGTTNYSVNGSIKAVMDRQIDPATVTSTSVTLKKGTTTVTSTATVDNSTRTINIAPDGSLDPFSTYTVSIGTAVAGWNGTGLVAPYTWTFTTGAGTPPTVSSTDPAAGTPSAPIDAVVKAVFSRKLDPTTVNGTTVKLAGALGVAVSGTVAYDDSTRTVSFDPTALLGDNQGYTATFSTGIKAADGTPMASAFTLSFTSGSALTVTGRTPNTGATGISTQTAVRATFSRAADPSTITSSSFKLTNAGGTQIAGTVSYDAGTQAATFQPNSPLALNTSYTATLASTVRAADGNPISGASTWSFTTASTAPPAPAVSGQSPAPNAQGVSLTTAVTATFDRPLDPASVTTTSVTLTPAGGTALAASVAYDPSSNKVTLTPNTGLATGTTYTVALTTAIRSSVGQPLASTVTWTFVSADCPCSLLSTATPALVGNDTADGRSGTGPFGYEMGMKIGVDTSAQLIAAKFWKDPGETGTHKANIWNGTGQLLGSVTFTNESASGWQRQALSTPITLSPGLDYTVSVNINTRYVVTPSGLASQIAQGPLHSIADGQNGLYGTTLGAFPTSTYHSNNYFVDAVVKLPGKPARTPQVSSTTPLANATGVSTAIRPKAAFNLPLDPSTVNGSSVTLTGPSGAVSGTVSYDDPTQTITFKPSSPLATNSSYTARLSGIKSDDETAMASAYTWSFTTSANASPIVTDTSPVDGATGQGVGSVVTATFSAAMDPTTITSSSFKLTGPDGSTVPASVSYTSSTNTAKLTPNSILSSNSQYTVTVTTAVKTTTGVAMDNTASWSFRTNQCPCKLMADTLTPQYGNLDVADGRSGAGPFSYELGTKFRVLQPANLSGIRYYKDANETGSHVGTLWTADGVQVAQVNFTGESASGWQQGNFTTPVVLQPNTVYVVSVGFNARFSMTYMGLADPLTVGGVLQLWDDGNNGVNYPQAGTFPTGSYRMSNYFVDPVVQ